MIRKTCELCYWGRQHVIVGSVVHAEAPDAWYTCDIRKPPVLAVDLMPDCSDFVPTRQHEPLFDGQWEQEPAYV